jgi:hypothetical protein
MVGRKDFLKLSALLMPQNIGYGITETLRNDIKAKDNAFIASMQIVKCLDANSLKNQQLFSYSLEDLDSRTRYIKRPLSLYCSIALPIIVVKGEIYECSLDENAKMLVSKSDNVVLAIPNRESFGKSYKISRNMIRLLTENKLAEYTQEAYQALSYLLSQEEAIKEVYNFENTKSSKSMQDEVRY